MIAAAELDSEVALLWSRFHSSGDIGVRERLIRRYIGLARTIAATLYGTRSDDTVSFDDYLQYARVGLIEAIDRYDSLRGTSFETYSSYRIRGAILNGLSRETEVRAQRHRRGVRLAEREHSLAGPMFANPESASLDDFMSFTVDLAVGFILEDGLVECRDESPAANPYAQAEVSQLQTRVKELVEQLPARERQVLKAHYYDQREFQEIAATLGVTKGRVSQLHSRAVTRVRERLNARPTIDRSL
jgi:RNA polymerase sigma factor for flagellar operon FliA